MNRGHVASDGSTGEAALLTPAEAAEEARAIASRGQVTADDVTDVISEMREAQA